MNFVENTCRRWKKVEVSQSIGCNQNVRGDDEGEEADYGEGGDEDTGDGCDCSLHQFAVGAVFRDHDYWGY